MGFNDLEWAHHLVVFVLEEVAVPDVAAGVALEGNDDSGDLAGFAANGVLPAGFFGRRGYGGGGVAEFALMFSPACWLKSKMMSGRSAGASRLRFIFMGDERRPWSLLTWCMGERLPKDRRKKRAFEPFMRRRRYLRGWTSR
jgi:hypothetical protein